MPPLTAIVILPVDNNYHRCHSVHTETHHSVGYGEPEMVAYLHKAPRNTWQLTICASACNGEDFAKAEKITVTGKREAAAICKARGATPHNF
jgi:hypothetical protein